jgi:glyoxylase-like metal-dependent hydrolase (beta-lactamase superfamily II)
MQGFRRTFGEEAGNRFGGVIPVPEDRIFPVADGEKISLGQRELQVIHTPGHAPHHLSFLDTRTGGLFCGDALGSYFSEIDVTMPPSAPATDPFLILQSITKLQEFHPEIIYFSHGRTTGRASEILQRYADDAGLCIKVALNGLKTGASDENIASKLADVLAKNSAKAREELLAWPYFIPVVVAGYRQYFNRSN